MTKEKTSGIYKITNIINEKYYYGSSINLNKRKQIHFKKLFCNNHHNFLLQKQYNKYKEQNFIFEIVELVPEKENLLLVEQKYLDLYFYDDKCLNLCCTAGNMFGFKFSEDSKKKMSDAWTEERKLDLVKRMTTNGSLYTTENTVGENNPFFGKKHTDETKIKLSEQAINKTFEERFGIQIAMEIKEKISKAGTGRKHIPTEYQIKIFELANEKRKKRIRVINTETGLDHIFESIREAAKELKISRSPLRDSLKKIYIKSKWLVTYVD